MHPRGSAQNRKLVAAYAKREVSLSYGVQVSFVIDGVEFMFQVRPDEKDGNILEVSANTRNPEELVMLIRGLNPCKATAFRPNGSFQRRLPPRMYRISTSLAVRDPNKRRREYLRDLRLAEAAGID